MIISYDLIERTAFYVEKGCHPKDALLIVTQGSFSCAIENESAVLRRGDAVFFPAGKSFERRVVEAIRCIYVQFDTLPSHGRLIYPHDDRQLRTLSLLEIALDRFCSTDTVAHFIKDIVLSHELSLSSSSKVDTELIAQCREYLELNCEKEINLSALAQKYGYTKQGLIYQFRKKYGTSPIAFLINARTERARRLLLSDQALSIGQIAELCGFSNAYYFSNSFKKATGMSPSRFRKVNRI